MQLPKIAEGEPGPRSWKETIYTSTPVVLTVLATILAGLSSGEMTRAQYFRAMAAQNQAKATDQWGYYQAKRLRAVEAQNSLDMLMITAHPGRLDAGNLKQASAELAAVMKSGAAGSDALGALAERVNSLDGTLQTALQSAAAGGDSIEPKMPDVVDKAIPDPDIITAMNDIDQHVSDDAMSKLMLAMKDGDLSAAFDVAQGNMDAFDVAAKSVDAMLLGIRTILAEEAEAARDFVRLTKGDASIEGGIGSAMTDLAAARLRYDAARYDRDAEYNGVLGKLYEVEVRQTGAIADRHRGRSAEFFYTMLGAQAGVTIATLSLAVRKRNILWSLAAAAGTVAVGLTTYFYLFT